MIGRSVKRRLGHADQQPHQGDAFVRAYGEVLNLVAALERFAQAQGYWSSVSQDRRNPCLSRKIHQSPPAARAALARV